MLFRSRLVRIVGPVRIVDALCGVVGPGRVVDRIVDRIVVLVRSVVGVVVGVVAWVRTIVVGERPHQFVECCRVGFEIVADVAEDGIRRRTSGAVVGHQPAVPEVGTGPSNDSGSTSAKPTIRTSLRRR